MRLHEVFVNGQWRPVFTDPAWWAANPPPPNVPTRLAYGPVREKIDWTVTFVNDNGTVKVKSAKLFVTELTLGLDGTTGRVATPLRIIDSSHRPGEVFKVGYPADPGVARKDWDPNEPGAQDDPNTPGDQRAEPVTPIPDWDTLVKAKDK